MSEDFESNIRRALKTRLATVAGVWPVSTEGRLYKPAIGTPYIREKLSFVSETPSANGTVSHRMVWNLSLFHPNGEGLNTLSTMRGRIFISFAPGLKLAYGGDALTVMETARSGNIEEPDWVSSPLAITIQAWTIL